MVYAAVSLPQLFFNVVRPYSKIKLLIMNTIMKHFWDSKQFKRSIVHHFVDFIISHCKKKMGRHGKNYNRPE